MSSTITYLNGDATYPQGEGNKIIAHVCNDIGVWGAGFVLSISKRWKHPENEYRAWREHKDFKLGAIQLMKVEEDIHVVNMIAQRGIKTHSSDVPLKYDALAECLLLVAEHAIGLNASVHMPRIGCGLAGGKWEMVEPIIQKTLVNHGISVYVYDYIKPEGNTK